MDNELLNGFNLDGMRIEPLNGMVRRDGNESHLPSKSMEVLLWLARNPRRLVPREELLERVWGKGHGGAESLNHAMVDIRHALGDRADAPRFIQTVPTRGYRLLVEPQRELQQPGSVAAAGNETPLWQALVRHGVVQAVAAYSVVGWVLIQVAGETFPNLGMPAWTIPFVTFAVVGGFPVVILLSWFLEMSSGRLELDRGQHQGGLLQGLGRNYLAVIAAYGIATIGATVYQVATGFGLPEVTPAPGISAATDPDSSSMEELIPVADNSIAVLRFENIDGSETTEIFAAGLSEDVLDGLARVPGLLVSSRGDAWSLGANAESRLIRRRLRVAHYLEGSVRIQDDTLRVVTQLIDSESGFHLMSRSFNRSIENFSDVQQEITSLIVANLRPALPESTLDVRAPEMETTLDAYVSYHRGKALLDQPRSISTIEEATGHFESALAIDPDYPAAYAGLCLAKTALYELDGDVSLVTEAESVCSRALQIGPRLPMVLRSVANLNLLTGDMAAAESLFRSALDIDEQDASSLLGLARVLERQRQSEEAEQLVGRAIELQPGNWRAISSLAALYFRTGEYAKAADAYRKVAYLDPSNHIALTNLGASLEMLGRFAEASAAFSASLDLEESRLALSNLGIAHYYLGEFEDAARLQRRAIALADQSASAWLTLADALYFSDGPDAAREAYRRAAEIASARLKIDSVDPEMLTILGWAEAMLGNTARARELLDRCLEVAPDDPYSHYFIAIFEANFGEPAAALRAAKEAVDRGYSRAMLKAEPHLAHLDLSNVD